MDSMPLKDKFGVDKIIVKKQSYQLLNNSREFFPSFVASNLIDVPAPKYGETLVFVNHSICPFDTSKMRWQLLL